MEFNKKVYARVSWLYGFIVVFANVCGVLIPNIFKGITQFSTNYEWLRFLSDYNTITDIIQYFTFVVPTVLCICYTNFCKPENMKSRFVNIPLGYSAIGITGWLVYFIENLVLLFIAKAIGYNVLFKPVLFSSAFNILLESIITFTLAYFTMESLHRMIFLPKYFKDEHISTLKGIRKPSIRFLFIVNYISVTVFPIIYLIFFGINLFGHYNLSLDISDKASRENLYFIFIIIFIGLLINTLLISYFENPIKKIKKRIDGIKEGDYKTHLNIATNDSFGELSDTLNEMTDSISEKTQALLDKQNQTILGMATMVESRDNSTGGHIKRTSDCVRVFVQELKKFPEYCNISEEFFDSVIRAAPLHDLGKIAVKDSILTKNGKFTDEEYEEMKKHSAEGARIVEIILASEEESFKKIAVNVAHYHHEKWNGMGYPEKISEENIPFEARIMALADVFDALVSKRCYKDAFTYDKAFGIIEESLGSHFDPELGKIFLKCRPQLESLYNGYNQE